ncbi:ULP PROTEASE domain-containing protein, partial [Aphis craccivora]
MNNKVNNGIEIRQSNATVESWFKTVKIDILEGNRRLKCSRFLRLMRERVMNKKTCTRALDFDSKARQINVKGNGKRKISESSSHNYLDATENWGKKEKQHKHLQHTKYLVDSIENVVVIKCDNVTMSTVNEPINNDVVLRDLSKPFDDNCLIKSVSTPASHKSPFRRFVQLIDFYKNMLPKELTYYKPINMPMNRDYL